MLQHLITSPKSPLDGSPASARAVADPVLWQTMAPKEKHVGKKKAIKLARQAGKSASKQAAAVNKAGAKGHGWGQKPSEHRGNMKNAKGLAGFGDAKKLEKNPHGACVTRCPSLVR